jgi:long-subunit acyl-CoA synthetase (AMP-forming)
MSAYATAYELGHALRTSRSTHLFVQPELLPKALEAAKEVGLPEDRIFILEGKAEGRRSFQDLIAQVKRSGAPALPVKPVHKDTLAYLVFSSGTSGLPKGMSLLLQIVVYTRFNVLFFFSPAVMISHGNIWAMITAQAIYKQEEDKIAKVV